MGASAPSVILLAAVHDPELTALFEGSRFAIIRVPTGTLALEWARDVQVDAIILQSELPDMTGVDACRVLHEDPRIGHNVPILILAPDKPTPEQRVTALRAGAWDFLRRPDDPEELSLRLQAYVLAKRSIDGALGDGLVDAVTGLHSRPGLARRARELAALMARTHGALSCVVFAMETDPADPKPGRLVATTVRASDVVGVLGATELAVLAPGTDRTGAVTLAERIAGALRASGTTPRVGYVAVSNLRYSPIDPVALLAHATTAVRYGSPEPGHPWVRRFEVAPPPGGASGGRGEGWATPSEAVADRRSVSP